MTKCLSNQDVEKHMMMVKAVVGRLLSYRRFLYFSIEREDLYQIGWLALNQALKTFDVKYGVKFDTYASKAIRNAVNKELYKLSKYKSSTLPTELIHIEDVDMQEENMKKIIAIVEDNNNFTYKERIVFWSRFIDDEYFADIAKKINVCRETARRMYNKSLIKIRKLLNDE